MKFAPTGKLPAAERRCRGFTLIEALAAMVVMAIVIPVAMQGLQVASRAGEFGLRRATAARVGQSKLDELVATGQWRLAAQNGVIEEGTRQYRWQLSLQPWTEGMLELATMHVYFNVSGREHEVRLSTLVDPTLQ